MRINLSYSFLILIFLLLFPCFIQAQTNIQGRITDKDTGEELIGANIIQEGTSNGTVTDYDGSFLIKIKDELPVNLVASYLGYDDQIITVKDKSKLKIELLEASNTIDVVVVTTSRISEKQKAAPLTVETMDVLAIKETPSDNFYDGLGSLKGVDLTAASLGFKVINTRGFNSTSPVRSLQTIDGVDNQAPGLNFSLGNFLGAPELDIRKVDIIQGASSSFYGPNAFNGVIAMETKNPFFTEGLSAQVKVAERNMLNTELRWADSFKNKDGLKNIAYKFTLSYLRADDWEANNDGAVVDTPTPFGNPGGWDHINRYGDEYNLFGDASLQTSNRFGDKAGLLAVHRQGYAEKDLVDYDTRNLKALAAVYFRTNPSLDAKSPELVLGFNYGAGTTVYQGDNRFSLKNITFIQPRIEFRKKDDYFIRAYMSKEDAGDSYDPYFTALRLEDKSQTFGGYFNRYAKWWGDNNIHEQMKELGYPVETLLTEAPWVIFDDEAADAWLADNQDLMNMFHDSARAFVNAPNVADGLIGRLVPGTAEFEREFNNITTNYNNTEGGGTRFYDKSALYHIHGEKKFNWNDFEIVTGANGRYYAPDSRGTIFYDTADIKITNHEFGIYTGLSKVLQEGKWRLNGTLRMDKGQNFKYIFTPAASVVWKPRPNHYARLSFSSGVRNPTLSDQYLFLNVGPAILAGNLNGADSVVTVESFVEYLGNFLQRSDLVYYDLDPIQPEKVKTIEAGYRATLFNNLYVDAGYYYSIYTDFIGYNIAVDLSFDGPSDFIPEDVQVYRYASNAAETVTTQGFSIGLNYYFADYLQFNGNYSFNALVSESDDPIVPAFNTPKHKFNLGVSGRKIGPGRNKNIGFNFNYKWIQGFLFEGSPQFTGPIPSYGLLNGQVNYKFPKVNTTVKLGSTNILNNKVFQTYGGPRIGRLAYISFLYEFAKKQ